MITAELVSLSHEDICIVIKVANHSLSYICDCGEARGLRAKDCISAAAIFISHTHIDHFVNFDTIMRYQLGIGRRVVVCGPQGIIDQVHRRIMSYCWNLIEADSIIYEVREIGVSGVTRRAEIIPPKWEIVELPLLDGEAVYRDEAVTVDAVVLDHHTDSVAYLFREDDTINADFDKSKYSGGRWIADLKSAYLAGDDLRVIAIGEENIPAGDLFSIIVEKKGYRLGIIMDHAASSENHQLIKSKFANCDEVYIESFFLEEDRELANKHAHSFARMSGQIMRESKVKSAHPVHYSRKYSQEQIEQLVSEFDREFGK